MDTMLIIIFAATFFVTAAVAIILFGSTPRDRLRARAEGIKNRKVVGTGGAGADKNAASVKKTEKISFRIVEVLAKRYVPNQSALKDRLSKAGLKISLGTYALISCGVGLSSFVGIAFGAGLNAATAAAISVAIGAMIPHMVIGYLIGSRRLKFTKVLPDAIDLMVRGLKAGLPITESMSTVARELQGPVQEEFLLISDGIRLGRPMDVLLWETANRLQIPEFKFFVISLSIQRETGGNLAETLGNLSNILRRRRQMKQKVRALSSEARASAYILGAMPFIMFTAMYLLDPEYVSVLYTDPRGIMLLSGGFISIVVGAGVMAKMVRFEI
jgi:tight adherence protein B